MNTPYEDINHLWKFGYWPGREVPEWAKMEAENLQCEAAHVVVIQRGLVMEIDRLEAELEK